MTRRILVNLISFAVLAGLLATWALTNYVTFGLTEPPSYEVRFAFSESPGLRPGFDVAYLGVQVGSITDVALTDDGVEVRGEVLREHELTADVIATIRRRSAVGEPYIDLSPAPEADLDGGPTLAEAGEVPLDRTRLPRSYEEVFQAVSEGLGAVPPEAVGTILEELGLALDGREGDITSAVRDIESVVATLSARVDLLDEAVLSSADLAAFLADESGQVASSTADLELLAASLNASREDITTLLDEAPAVLDGVAALVNDSRGPLGCLVSGVESVLAVVDTPQNTDALRSGLSRTDELLSIVDAAIHERSSGPFLRVDAQIRLGGAATADEQPPAAPGQSSCGDLSVEDEEGLTAAVVDPAATPDPIERRDIGADGLGITDRQSDADGDLAQPSSDERFALFDLPPWVLLLPLLVAAGLALAARWRRDRGGEG